MLKRRLFATMAKRYHTLAVRSHGQRSPYRWRFAGLIPNRASEHANREVPGQIRTTWSQEFHCDVGCAAIGLDGSVNVDNPGCEGLAIAELSGRWAL